MRESFRQAMAYLHTWLGLVLGFVLMVCFFFGSLSVFDREIDRWSVPETRIAAAPFPSFDQYVLPLIAQVRPSPESVEQAAREVVGPLPPTDELKAGFAGVYTNHRDPILRLYVDFDIPNRPKDPSVDHVHAYGYAAINPHTGERLPAELEERLNLGSDFFFPLHYMLHVSWHNLGYWIVGLAGMAMLAALVSGVVMHRRIFREFFTFRPYKSKQRSILDLHNMTGVLALPFMFVITLSGVLIFNSFYLPSTQHLMRPLIDAQEEAEEARTGLPHDPAGRPGALAPVDAMMIAAKAHWAAQGVPGEIGSVAIAHPGDALAYVSISRDSVDRVATAETLHYKASTGTLLYEDPPPSAIEAVNGFLYGLHFQLFKHWALRWLLFAGGLVGCACIATGFLFFVEKRKKQHAAAGGNGVRIVDSLAVATVTGILIATTAMLLANRLLPTSIPNHSEWQMAVFWFSWLAALIHAGARSRPVSQGGVSPAWAEQALIASGLAVAAVIANWVTTGDHLLKTISEAYWPVAGVDLVLIASACGAVLAARQLHRQRMRGLADETMPPEASGAPAHV